MPWAPAVAGPPARSAVCCTVPLRPTTDPWYASPPTWTPWKRGTSLVTEPQTLAAAAEPGAARDDPRAALLALRTEWPRPSSVRTLLSPAWFSPSFVAVTSCSRASLAWQRFLVRAVAAALSLQSTRVQFTPDLMPGDVTGSLVTTARTAAFSFREDLHQPAPGRRDQPHAPQDPGVPARRWRNRSRSRGAPASQIRSWSLRRRTRLSTREPIRPEAQLSRFLLKLTLPLPPRDEEIGADPARRRLRAARPRGGRHTAGGRRARTRGRVPPCAASRSRPRCWRTSSTWRGRRRSPRRPAGGVAARRHRPATPRRNPGHGSLATTASPQTTSRRWLGPRCAIGFNCARRPSSRRPATG